MNTTKLFTGIGTRTPPKNIEKDVIEISRLLFDSGYILRSGGADGMDTLFEVPYKFSNNKEIYLPWKGFNKHKSNLFEVKKEAQEIASFYHPAWKRLNTRQKLLHGRNSYQVLGYELKIPSKFIICYTKDGAEDHLERKRETGGTGTAISIASYYNVPVINMFNPKWKERILKLL